MLGGPKSLTLSLRNVYETLAVSFPTLIEAARGPIDKQTADDRLASWCRRVVDNARIDLTVVGREHLKPGATYLIMSNHQSLYDVPVLYYAIGPNIRMVAKKELFKVPVFGRALAAGGFVSIDRGDRESAIESLETAKRLLATGTHVWLSPEGTRSRSGELLPFKKGGFHLAVASGLPVLPVTVRGTRDVLEAKGLRSVAGAHVTVTIHRPLDPRDYAKDEKDKGGRERLMEDVRRAIASGL